MLGRPGLLATDPRPSPRRHGPPRSSSGQPPARFSTFAWVAPVPWNPGGAGVGREPGGREAPFALPTRDLVAAVGRDAVHRELRARPRARDGGQADRLDLPSVVHPVSSGCCPCSVAQDPVATTPSPPEVVARPATVAGGAGRGSRRSARRHRWRWWNASVAPPPAGDHCTSRQGRRRHSRTVSAAWFGPVMVAPNFQVRPSGEVKATAAARPWAPAPRNGHERAARHGQAGHEVVAPVPAGDGHW